MRQDLRQSKSYDHSRSNPSSYVQPRYCMCSLMSHFQQMLLGLPLRLCEVALVQSEQHRRHHFGFCADMTPNNKKMLVQNERKAPLRAKEGCNTRATRSMRVGSSLIRLTFSSRGPADCSATSAYTCTGCQSCAALWGAYLGVSSLLIRLIFSNRGPADCKATSACAYTDCQPCRL